MKKLITILMVVLLTTCNLFAETKAVEPEMIGKYSNGGFGVDFNTTYNINNYRMNSCFSNFYV